jgi:hypothetical protein
MSVLGVPVMTKRNYALTESSLGEWWRTQFEKSCLEAGEEEKRLAVERGDYHQDVPAITVVVDGGWSKRSHKHSYNAKSGVAIIIGQETGKLFFLVCATNIAQPAHRGFLLKNIAATGIGAVLHLRWKLILFWKVSRRLSKCMECDT